MLDQPNNPDDSAPAPSAAAIEALRGLIGDEAKLYPLADGEVQVVTAHLPHGVPVCLAREKVGRIWVVLDPNQASAVAHLREMLGHWPDGLDPQIANIYPIRDDGGDET